EIARLGLQLQVRQQKRRYLAERFFVGEPLTRARGDLFATAREILLERLGVARELRAQLLDLAPQVARVRILDRRFVLSLHELLTLRLEQRLRRPRALEDLP